MKIFQYFIDARKEIVLSISWAFVIAFPSAVVFCIFAILPTENMDRRQFMSGCITARGLSDQAQRECYASWSKYHELDMNDFVPSGEMDQRHD